MVAVVIGNVLEWYDFVLYGYFAVIIAGQFFPAESNTASLLAAFAAFGIGSIFRPLGAVVIGTVSDKIGRKTALVATMTLMAFGTFLTGIIPSYATIGILAPVSLVAARLLQGFSAGGEWGASITYLVESAPEGRRGLYGSLQQATVVAGLLLASAIAAAVTTLLSPETAADWGWRVPFLVGAVIGPVGIFLRRNINEPPLYRRHAKSEYAEKPKEHAIKIGHALGITIVWAVMAYIFLVYMPTFTAKYAGVTRATALWSNTLMLTLIVFAIPLCGLLSDRIGRKPPLLVCCLALIVLPYPLFSMMLASASVGAVVVSQLLIGLSIALYLGAAPAAIAELFKTGGRTTNISIINGFSNAIFGGFAPFIATWLIERSGSLLSPVYYVIAAAAFSAALIFNMRETAHEKLN